MKTLLAVALVCLCTGCATVNELTSTPALVRDIVLLAR